MDIRVEGEERLLLVRLCRILEYIKVYLSRAQEVQEIYALQLTGFSDTKM